jgi:hypothetical protein
LGISVASREQQEMTLSPGINENESMRDVWFTADFHFGHFNIIRSPSQAMSFIFSGISAWEDRNA